MASEDYDKALQLKIEEEKVKKEKKSLNFKGLGLTSAPRAVLTLSHIEEVVSQMSGLSLKRISEPEKKKLLRLASAVKKVIVGQDEAVSVITSALKRSRSGIKEEGRPVGSFLFLGPSGVGKSELAKVLANIFFENTSSFIKIAMSEFSEGH